jgi:transcriptional regulator with XRE-family HTH domain
MDQRNDDYVHPEDPVSPLGGLFREYRQRRGLSQRKLAARMGTTRDVLRKWENGSKFPSVPNFIMLIRSLRIPWRKIREAWDEDAEL